MSKIASLLAEKHRLHKLHIDDPSSIRKKQAFASIRRIVQANLRKMQDEWLSKNTEETQGFADSKDSKRFYDALKALHCPQTTSSSPLLSADGSTLVTQTDIQGANPHFWGKSDMGCRKRLFGINVFRGPS